MKKKITRITAAVTIMVMLVSVFSAAFAAEVPEDVKNEALKEALSVLMDDGAVTGDVDGLYHPEANLTRAQVCCIIVKLIDPPQADLNGSITVKAPGSGFSDLKGYSWAAPYINYASRHGITNGYPDGTFKPGSNVTINELVTFALRAAGYRDGHLTDKKWPDNYRDKADELDLYRNCDAGQLNGNTKALKSQAAIIIYNVREDVKNGADKQDVPQGTDNDNPQTMPDLKGFKYAEGVFNSNMTGFAGKDISPDAKVYVYGVKKDYSKDMKLSEDRYDYRESNVYKYKNVDTPLWYKMENGKISELIIPGDSGFSGRIYGMINGTGSRVLNYEDKAVRGIETLTAGREIMWLSDSRMSSFPSFDRTGTLYELIARNGEITKISKSGDTELTGQLDIIDQGTVDDIEKDRALISVGPAGSAKWYEVKENATVYRLNDKKDAYETSRLSSIRKTDKVILYDISDDKNSAADIVVFGM